MTPTFTSFSDEEGRLTRKQIERLTSPIDPSHVEQKRGMSYMAQHEVRAELTRIFGFGNWDSQVEEMTFLYETRLVKGDSQYPTKGSAPEYWVVAYRASVRLNIRDYGGRPICSFVEYHAEENAPLPNRGEAHAMAITSVESYALRRAAIGLGDRLGLGLYNKGQIIPLVKGTLQLIDPESPQSLPQAGAKLVPSEPAPETPAELPNEPSPTMQKFHEAQAQVQEGNAQARDPYLDRVQSGLKVDE